MSRLAVAALLACCLPFAPSLVNAKDYPTAGSQPDRRPDGAPRQPAIKPNANTLAKMTYGITRPLPRSIVMLNIGGRWFTPFDHPGMTGPYDLRGWHQGRGAQTN